MEPKRELTSVDLAALVGELRAFEGAGVDKVYLYEDGLVRFKCRHYDRGRVELLVDTGETKHARVADPERVPDAPDRPPNFAMMLRNRLAGAELVDVRQFEFDRILVFEFERDGETTEVVAELFGDGNLAVLDATGTVVDCLETVRLKSRTVAPGSVYEFPDARFNPLTVDYDGFAARVRQSDADVVRTLATQLNFGGLWGEEICTRAGVAKTEDVADLSDADLEALYDTVGRLADDLQAGDLDPRVYYESDGEGGDGDENSEATGEETAEPNADGEPAGRRVDVTPVRLSEYEGRPSRAFETFNAALDDYVTNFEADPGSDSQPTGSDRPDFESEIETKRRIIEQQEEAIAEFEEEAERERAKAESLYANYDLVAEILETVQDARDAGHSWDDIADRFAEGSDRGIPAAEAVEAVDGSEGSVTVTVDGESIMLVADTGVEKNADRLYTEAKRIETKREGAEEAVANTREELQAIQERRDEWEAADGPGGPDGGEGAAGEDQGDDEGDGDDAEPVDWLARASIPIRQGEKWYDRFRWFHTTDDFLVIGGRNADQNEELVKKYLEPGDRFFHAQAHGGPVTLLKATDPSESYSGDVSIPDASLEQTATFAVSYSSVWKDGKYSGDAYVVGSDQVSKTPESGEYLEKGGFAIRGDRTYFEDVEVGVAVGITCEPETRVVGGPPAPIREQAETTVTLEPGKFAQNDVAKRVYREFRDRFADQSFVRKVASPDLIQEFLPPGGSRIVD